MNYKILNSILFIAGSACISEVQAACNMTNYSAIDVSMSVGRVVVRPSDEVGKILRKATFSYPRGSTWTCDRNGGVNRAILDQNNSASPLGNNIYNTNIPGIGIRLYRELPADDTFSGYYPYRVSSPRGNKVLGAGFFVVEIIKTGSETGSGALVPGRYSNYYEESMGAGRPLLTSTVYGNAITIASSSCEWQGNINKTVQLPTVNKADFKGIGSTQGEQAFDLNILCNGGKSPSDYTESNKISLSFDYNAATGTNNQVLANDAPARTRANGVGVQLVWDYQKQNKVIAKNDKLTLGTLRSNQSIQYNVPMKARYYQTASNVSPGTVRGMATVTIEYD
ncbi:fimbrial protein [Acinetobacter sp. WZC-1]|uniref:fimbrial protein n=1 Tax=Acinetobacter sp. WZC-1 TaxID=3459034 RepID=UPI00403D73BE